MTTKPFQIPKVGNKIQWHGTEYIVIGVKNWRGDSVTVTVKLGNGYSTNLWWWHNPGCKIIT